MVSLKTVLWMKVGMVSTSKADEIGPLLLLSWFGADNTVAVLWDIGDDVFNTSKGLHWAL